MEAKPAIKKAVPVDPSSVSAANEAKQQTEPVAVWESLTEGSIVSVGPGKSGAIRKPRAATVRERTSQKKWLIGGGIGVGVLLMVLLGMLASGVFKVKTKDGTIVLENVPLGAEVMVDDEKVTVSWHNGGKQAEIRVKPGTHKVEIKKDGISVDGKELTLKDGEREILTVRLLPEKREAKAKAPPLENVPPKPELSDEPKTEPSEYVNSLGMKFRLIPAGTFIMGSSPAEIERCINLKLSWPPAEQFESEGPEHEVEITKPFYIGIHEVTVGQFRQFVKAMDYKTQAEKEGGAFSNPPDREGLKIDGATNWRNPGFEQTDDHPVVCVSWNDAEAFCAWLSEKEGRTYRLPSEAEWEYCCRAKTTTRFCCGDDETRLKEFANIPDASFNQKWPLFHWRGVAWDDGYPFTAPVGQFQTNAFGLHDMHGNVWEWCADWYDKDYYRNSPKQDPPGPSAGNGRVIRGGSWINLLPHGRSTFRSPWGPRSAWFLGFRVVLLPEKRVAKADAPSPNSRPVHAPPPTTPRRDYDDLAKGRWVDVLPSVEEFNRLRTEKSYRGAEPKYVGGSLECNGTSRLLFPSIKAKHVIVRAWMKRSGPKHAGNAGVAFLYANNESLGAGFNGDGYFFIGRTRNKVWKDFAFWQFSEPYEEEFEFAFAVVEGKLIAYANGRKILETQDDAPNDGPAIVGIGTFRDCSGLFRNIEIQVLDNLLAADKNRNIEIKQRPVSPAAKLLRAGSVWQGTRTYRKRAWAGITVSYEIHVVESNGTKFKGVKFDNGPGRNRIDIEGEIYGNVLTWREGGLSFLGSLQANTIQVFFNGPLTEGDGKLTLRK
jgi:formylglycine-generating enzyme required for sulfatase activity